MTLEANITTGTDVVPVADRQSQPDPAVSAPVVAQLPADPPVGFRRESAKVSDVLVEKHWRSLLKAISWRTTGTVDTIIISFLITGKIKLAVSIGFVEVFTKVSLFYLHERLWNKIPLGRAKAHEDYTI